MRFNGGRPPPAAKAAACASAFRLFKRLAAANACSAPVTSFCWRSTWPMLRCASADSGWYFSACRNSAERLIQPTLLLQDGAEHVVGLRVVGLGVDGRAEGVDGFGGTRRLPEHDAQRVVGIGQARVQAHCFPQRGLGAGEIVLLLERGAQVVERLGVFGTPIRERAQHSHRTRQVALLHERRAEIQPRGRLVRMRGDQLREGRDGLVGGAALHQREAQRVEGVEPAWLELQRAAKRASAASRSPCSRRAMPRCAWATASVGASVVAFSKWPMASGKFPSARSGQPEVVLRLGVARLQLRGGLERRQGFLRVAAQPFGHAKVILRVEERRGSTRRRARSFRAPGRHGPEGQA